MRRMVSNNQVIDIVNKGIEEGEIEAGGLTPEQKEKLDNALALPKEAPTEQQLVGINTSGKQNALNIGDGLAVVDGELQINGAKILVIDANNIGLRNSFEITEDQYTKLENHTYDFLVIKNTGIPSADESSTLIFTYQYCYDQSGERAGMYYMTSAVAECDSTTGLLSTTRQYMALLDTYEDEDTNRTVYEIFLTSFNISTDATDIITLRACNGRLYDYWDEAVLGNDPIQALRNHVIEFKYVDSTKKDDSNAPYYEAIPVFYAYRTDSKGSATPAGRVTFYSAPGVIFKDFNISFTKDKFGTLDKWTLTEITQ